MLLLSLSDTLFYLFSLLAIASAFVVVTTPNPVHAVLFLVSSFAGAREETDYRFEIIVYMHRKFQMFEFPRF